MYKSTSLCKSMRARWRQPSQGAHRYGGSSHSPQRRLGIGDACKASLRSAGVCMHANRHECNSACSPTRKSQRAALIASRFVGPSCHKLCGSAGKGKRAFVQLRSLLCQVPDAAAATSPFAAGRAGHEPAAACSQRVHQTWGSAVSCLCLGPNQRLVWMWHCSVMLRLSSPDWATATRYLVGVRVHALCGSNTGSERCLADRLSAAVYGRDCADKCNYSRSPCCTTCRDVARTVSDQRPPARVLARKSERMVGDHACASAQSGQAPSPA